MENLRQQGYGVVASSDYSSQLPAHQPNVIRCVFKPVAET